MSFSILDNDQRNLAIDPYNSFIVQAPAGSGKTEILTQRYLRLLSCVQEPESVVALTFTRKAACEMRERIILALKQAHQELVPITPHQQQTYKYAKAALIQDQRLTWNLLQNPTRLRILTFDGLCYKLSRHQKQIADKPHKYYLKAARECINYAMQNPAYHNACKVLMLHVDNRLDKLIHFLQDLLSKRDQWLAPLYQAKLQNNAIFAQGLQIILQHEIARLQKSLPTKYLTSLLEMVSKVLGIEYGALDQENCQALANILLTSQNKFRKSFDQHSGLKKDAFSPREYAAIKALSKELFSKLSEYPDFVTALIKAKALPPAYYNAQQWEVLQALFDLLPLLVANLQVIFDEQNIADFINIAQLADTALGQEESPSDLALCLDYQINHLLIDEFQDTSIQQFQLLTKLVQGWQPADGKTMFIVGDPMQSIYRFRAAEVGLFLRVKLQGLGPLKLTALTLNSNFRSTNVITDWVNNNFSEIFPLLDDIESGCVSYAASRAITDAMHDSFIQAVQCEDLSHEANALITAIITEQQKYPDQQIAILVRSRQQLKNIIPCLRQHEIPFQGVEIDHLSHLPYLQDICSITQALLLPSNRLVWLAMLRSPWAGLTLQDLYQIAQFDVRQSIYFALANLASITDLTPDGRARAEFIYKSFSHAFAQRQQQSLVEWILSLLNTLHLKHILNPSEQADLEQYWKLLEQFELDGQLADFAMFKSEFNQLYSQQTTRATLQIMTIHKSKGLEFDTVLLPGLSAKTGKFDTPLFRWLKLPTDQDNIFLVAPKQAAGQDKCLLYEYLNNLEHEKDYYELQRLLYVAVTRAKKRLYLFDNRLESRPGSFRNLLKKQEFDLCKIEPHHDLTTNADIPERIYLPIDFYAHPPAIKTEAQNHMGFFPTNTSPRIIGVIIHELLQWICTYHPASYSEVPWHLSVQQLQIHGFTGQLFDDALQLIKQQIFQLFQDPRGKWLINRHEAEQNEYPLIESTASAVNSHVIDRTFIENNTRWIIDFKTGEHNTNNLEKHREQLNTYANLFTKLETRPTRCGIYYLAIGSWVDWEYGLALV